MTKTVDTGEGDCQLPSVTTALEAKGDRIATENSTHTLNSSGGPSIHEADNDDNEDTAYETRDTLHPHI